MRLSSQPQIDLGVTEEKEQCQPFYIVNRLIDVRRTLNQNSIDEEFEIAVNGPSFAHCDGVVKEAMELYWTKNKAKGGEGRWHFFRRVDLKRTKYPGTSSTITKYTNAKEAVPFME